MDVYKSQAKQILAGLTERSPSKCSIDSGPFAFPTSFPTRSSTWR